MSPHRGVNIPRSPLSDKKPGLPGFFFDAKSTIPERIQRDAEHIYCLSLDES
jgi:hypothetical protein